MTEQRKLAAIMFTDIIGYTRLMSQDEQKALQILQKNRDTQKPLVKKHSGEFLKEMGDGTLLCFQSALDAVRCALEIQHAIKDDPELNLRIGIHLGDIVFKEGDVFGDGVNVASRIERLAEGGGICISEQVYETIRNKPGIEAEFLGEKRLKNVDRPVKVYALKEGGLAFPQKAFHKPARFSWLKKRKYPVIIVGILVVFAILTIIYMINSKDSLNLDENLIAVAVFENQTGDESLDPIGRMTSDWITQGIASTGLVSVMPSFKLKTINEIHQNMDGIRSLAEETTAHTIITGVFYKEGDNLQFHAHIVDAGRGEVLSAIGPVNGPVDDPLKPIELTRQKVMGALAANFDQNFNNYSDRTLKPSLYEAYREFLIGIDLFFKYEFDKACTHFYRAAELDTTYYLSLLWACKAHYNKNELHKVDSLVKIFEVYQTKLTKGEQHLLSWLIAYFNGDREGAFEAAQQVAQFNLVFKYQQCMDAMNANHPQFAIDVLTTLEHDKLHFPGWTYEILAQSYHMTGDYDKELKTAQEGRKKHSKLFTSLWNELKALAALGEFEEIQKRFDESLNLPKSNDWSPATPGWLMFITAQELRAHGYPEEAMKAIERSIEWYNAQSADEYRYDLAAAYYVAERWDESQKLFELLAEEEHEKIEYWGYLGLIAAQKENHEEAERISTLLADLDRPYLFGKHSYWRARIVAVLGNKELAVQLLRDAIAQGFNLWYYDILIYEAMDFESLQDYPPFQELIKPK